MDGGPDETLPFSSVGLQLMEQVPAGGHQAKLTSMLFSRIHFKGYILPGHPQSDAPETEEHSSSALSQAL